MSKPPIIVAILLMTTVLSGCVPAAQQVIQVTNEQPLVVEESPSVSSISDPLNPVTPDLSVDRFDVDLGRFDGGKMWTFDSPPVDWLAEAYEIEADSLWFQKARLGALRFGTQCSASFVSNHGLILTNHHCARESIARYLVKKRICWKMDLWQWTSQMSEKFLNSM